MPVSDALERVKVLAMEQSRWACALDRTRAPETIHLELADALIALETEIGEFEFDE